MKTNDHRQLAVRKPRTICDAELNTEPAIELIKKQLQLPASSIDEINYSINAATLQRLSSSYAHLMDAILSYLRDYSIGKGQGTVMISKFEPYPADRIHKIPMDDVIVIFDKFKNFCNRAGIINPMQRKALLDEIQGVQRGRKFPGFSAIGLTRIVRNKETKEVERIAFRKFSFLSYEIGSVPSIRLNNLKNLGEDPLEAVSTIKLQLNYELFESVLPNRHGKKTRGFYWVPDRLEMWLREAVRGHKNELYDFCKKQGFYYINGTRYTKTIRALFTSLTRETSWPKDKDGFINVKKPIKNTAAACCGGAFTGCDLKAEFKKKLAVELLSHALEVLKHMYHDGVEFIEIADYKFEGEKLIIRMKHHDGKEQGNVPQLC